jgi:hypothetical protein
VVLGAVEQHVATPRRLVWEHPVPDL